MKTAYLFSGQGAQYEGMGRDLAQNNPAIKEFYDLASKQVGFDLLALTEEELKDTRYSQLATFAHSIAIWQFLNLDVNEDKYFAGFSLGEYSSYFAAGLLSLEDALNLIKFRSNSMADSSTNNPSAMFAVLNLDDDIIEKHLDENYNGKVWPVNYNSPGQLVISGLEDDTQQAADELVELGARRAVKLNTSGAFHTPLMQEAASAVKDFSQDIEWTKSSNNLYSNYSANLITEAELANMPAYLEQHMVSPVMWKQSILDMYDRGVRTFIEFGPGKTLSGLVKRILRQEKDIEILNIDTQEDLESFLER